MIFMLKNGMKWGSLIIVLFSHLALYAVRFSDVAKANCQQMDVKAGTVTLIFATDSNHFAVPKDSILKVYVSGSINDMQDMSDGYQLDQYSEDSCFYRTFTCAELSQPGNSGQPEFVFFVLMRDSSGANYYAYDQRKTQIDSCLLIYNGIPYTMILMPCGADYFTTDRAELAHRVAQAREIRPLADFNLNDSVDQHRISNFRLTPGTKNLYRSYHPFYPSNPQYDTEMQRLHWIGELAEKAKVGSDICLTGDMTYAAGQKVYFQGDSVEITIPGYYQQMIDSGHVLYVGGKAGATPSVAQCYYHSEDSMLARWIGEIIQFINDEQHPVPMLTHCAIGADRTGMICAIFAALCGADWAAISADYSETGNMKIQTYRHPNRLRYGLQRMTGLDPATCNSAQLEAAIRYHLVERMQVVTNEQIDSTVIRLTQLTPAAVESVCSQQRTGKRYDLLGREVDATHCGLTIEDGALILRP